MFEDSEDKKERGEFSIRSDAFETHIHKTTQEDIIALLDNGNEVDYDIIPDTYIKPIPTGDTDQSVYK